MPATVLKQPFYESFRRVVVNAILVVTTQNKTAYRKASVGCFVPGYWK
jgi:hypothetical protein